ncbi:MAG: helix-turn-helix domain-containing protein [Gammaproteobacteria bacterium]|nr:helix-turn-helix domain-containing protein [Gammaproteobacteria bacterium]
MNPKTKRSPNPIDVHVGARVRMRRVLEGFSQESLGERLGLTFQQVQKYEKGTNRISASRLYQIAGVLTVPVEYFFEGLPHPDESSDSSGFAERGSGAPVVDFLSSTEGLQLNKTFSEIRDATIRRKFIELARAFAGAQDDDQTA